MKKSKEYTGINRFFKSETLQKLQNRKDDGTFNDFISDWKWILSFSGKYKGFVFLYIVLGLLSSSLGLVSSYVSMVMINIVVEKQTERLWFLVVAFAFSTVFSILLSSLVSRIGLKISIHVNNDIQKEIFGKIMDSDWTAMKKYQNGDLLNRFSRDVNTVSGNAIHWIPNLIVNIYTFLITFIVLFRMDPIMAWIAVISAPVLVLLSRYIMKKMGEYKKRVLEMNSKMMSFEVETFYNMDMIKSFGIAENSTNELTGLQEKYKNLNLDYNKFEIKAKILTALLSAAVTAVAFGYCLFRLWNGQILYGEMSFFLSRRYALTGKFKTLIATVPDMVTSAVSAHRIKELVDLPKEHHDSGSFEALKPFVKDGLTVKMNGVSFAYEDGEKVYEGGCFVARPNEIIAVLGPSGEGKTTMLRLLLGLIHPESGTVTLECSDGTAFGMNADLRSLFSYVPQGNTLLSGTVEYNMRMVRKDATDEEIIEALKLACAWDFLEKTPEGIYHNIGEKGRGLSEGQAQRIAIARAILNDSPILLLDEATGALDEETEKTVLKNIIRQRPNKTCIISTHRKAVLKMCQRIYMIRDKKTEVFSDSSEESDFSSLEASSELT